MARLFHRPSGGAFLATPAYSDVGAGFAFALFESAKALERAGWSTECAILSGDCHVDDSRNRLVAQFLESKCTDLVFLDADVRWNADSLVNLLAYDRDVVSATYPYREGDRGFPGQFLPGAQHADDAGLLEVEAVPTGFLRIRRHVLEALAEKAPKFMSKSGTVMPLIFERTLEGQTRYGGDITFCRKWRAMGGKIWLDPEIEMEHGPDTCSYGHHKRVELFGGLEAGLIEINERIETPTTYNDMGLAWGNAAFRAGGEFIAASVELARKHPNIIECGSGLSTLAMRATGANVLALEHDKEWIKKTGATYSEITNGFYSSGAGHYDLAIIDGPPRYLGDRRKFLDSGITANLYLIDDAEDDRVMELARSLGTAMKLSNRAVVVYGNGA